MQFVFYYTKLEIEHGAVSNLIHPKFYRNKEAMTQEAAQIEEQNFEATTDWKKIFTPKQWLERFRQYTKRKYKMDIAELIRGKNDSKRMGHKRKPNTS